MIGEKLASCVDLWSRRGSSGEERSRFHLSERWSNSNLTFILSLRINLRLLMIQGGGWCYSLADCATRAGTYLGSSTKWAKQFGLTGRIVWCPLQASSITKANIERQVWKINSPSPCFPGIVSTNSSVSAFATWNHVVIGYCDGGSFS